MSETTAGNGPPKLAEAKRKGATMRIAVCTPALKNLVPSWVKISSCMLILTLVAATTAPAMLFAQDAPAMLLAQEACDDRQALENWLVNTRSLVDKYAPVYWFGPTELYHPTMPFWTAFDGRNNNENPLEDFADSTEINATWGWLDTLYRKSHEAGETEAIFFRVRPLDSSEIDDLWRYLISDEQAWRRRDIHPDTLKMLQAASTEFVSIEFYAYYLNDYGLIGHPNDVEFVYVLAPRDPVLANRFRIVVGAGHTQRIPNNVLVLSGELAKRNTESNVIVELGDHSSAPDAFPYSVFNRGLDANWHAYDIWGTRDTQASGGLGATGRYEPWMTFPRDSMDRLIPPVSKEAYEEARILAQERQRLVGGDLVNLSDTPAHQYALIATQPLECAFRELEKAEVAQDSLIIRVEDWFDLAESMSTIPYNFEHFQLNGLKVLEPDQKPAAIQALQEWNQGLLTAGGTRFGPEKVLVWRSKHYRSRPTRSLKQHLFRPVLASMQRFGHYVDLLNLWVTVHAGNALLVQSGIEVPAFWLPIRLRGYLEAHVGLYYSCMNVANACFDRKSFAASLLHTNDYRDLTWYARISLIPKRAEVDETPGAPDWLLGAGLSVTTFPPLRIRVGLSSDLSSKGPQFDTTRWELIVSRL